jgi:hypothetical protein
MKEEMLFDLGLSGELGQGNKQGSGKKTALTMGHLASANHCDQRVTACVGFKPRPDHGTCGSSMQFFADGCRDYPFDTVGNGQPR